MVDEKEDEDSDDDDEVMVKRSACVWLGYGR